MYISYDGLTDPLGQSQVLPYLQLLSKQGIQFTVLSFEKKDRLQKEGATVKRITDRAHITWKPLLFTARPPVVSKMYDRYRMWRTASVLHKKNRFDLIHCRSYVAAETGLRLKKRSGVKMLFDMRGFWADERVDNGQWSLQNSLYRRIYRHYKKKEKGFLLHADGIVSLTQAAKDYLLQQPGYGQLDIEVIPCCADLEHFNYATVKPEAIAALKSSLNIPAYAKVITYSGSVGGWYMIREMFSFFIALQQQDPDYVLLFLTKDDPEAVRKQASEAGIANEKIVVTYSGRQQMPQFLALSHCGIFFIKNSFSKMASSPVKHAELMGMGIPVICNSIGDTGKIITETGTGLLVDDFSNSSMAAVVQKVAQLESIDKNYIRSCALKYFDLKNGVQKYSALYNKIFSSTRPA